jgi:hypothetical protein
MMEMMINTARKNMEALAGMQARNEEVVRVMLDHAAKTRQQVIATNESLLNIVAEQGKAAEAFVSDSVKAGREMVEKQVQETRKAMAAK